MSGGSSFETSRQNLVWLATWSATTAFSSVKIFGTDNYRPPLAPELSLSCFSPTLPPTWKSLLPSCLSWTALFSFAHNLSTIWEIKMEVLRQALPSSELSLENIISAPHFLWDIGLFWFCFLLVALTCSFVLLRRIACTQNGHTGPMLLDQPVPIHRSNRTWERWILIKRGTLSSHQYLIKYWRSSCIVYKLAC